MINGNLPPITPEFFQTIQQESRFEKFVVDEFIEEAQKAYLAPLFAEDLLKDAYHGYMRDAGGDDYFRLCGNLAYWLNRNSPVIEWKKTSSRLTIGKHEQNRRDLIAECGRAYHAFVLGYRVCRYFESHQESAQKLPSPPNEGYIKDVCLAMKQENVIPAHAIGLIYRSLFVR